MPKPLAIASRPTIIKTVQFKVKSGSKLFSRGRCEVNAVWNKLNAYAYQLFEASNPQYCAELKLVKQGKFNWLFSHYQLKQKLYTLPKITPFDLNKLVKGWSKDFAYINSGVIQQINLEYAVRRQQFRKYRLRWRQSYGLRSEKSLGWIPLKQENLMGFLGQVKVIGRNADYPNPEHLLYLTQPEVRNFYQGKTCNGLKTNPDFQLKVLNKPIKIYNQKYLLFYLHALGAKVKTGSLSENASGTWFLNLTVEIDQKLYQQNYLNFIRHYDQISPQGVVGIDPGVKALATLSTGKCLYGQRRYFKQYFRKTALLQSKNHRKAYRRLNQKLKNKRADYVHKQSSKIVKTFHVIKFGDLDISALMKRKNRSNHQSSPEVKANAKTKSLTNKIKPALSPSFGKTLSSHGLYQFKSCLISKSNYAGRIYHEVSEKNSTRECSKCGHLTGPAGPKHLHIRTWVCSNCRKEHKRDKNSGIVLSRRPEKRSLCSGAYKKPKIELRSKLPIFTHNSTVRFEPLTAGICVTARLTGISSNWTSY